MAVGFKGINKKEQQTLLWQDFYSKFLQKYPDQKLEDTAYDWITDENRLGEGAKKIVYSIDGIDDYVLGYLKDKPAQKDSTFAAYKDDYPGFNFGQPILGNNADLIIMKKISGDTHGVSDWTAKFRSVVYGNQKISQEDAKLFLSQIDSLEKFPIESFIDLANQIRFLTDKNIKIDMFNPNNILIDKETKKNGYSPKYLECYAKYQKAYNV